MPYSSRPPSRGFRGQVHQTMSAASASATSISRMTTHIARPASVLLAAILLAAGCAQVPPGACPCPPKPPAPAEARYEAVNFADLPGWNGAPAAASVRAFVGSCRNGSNALAMKAACAEARALPAGDDDVARAFFERAFAAYAVIAPDGAREGQVTGYYEPVLEGSRSRSARFTRPVFGLPDDLVVVDLASQYPELRGLRLRGRLNGRRLEPYYARGEIEARGTAFPAPVIAWVADPVELFFLQIQGSGQIQLESGERIRVGFAEHNGYPYRSLGRYLVERGEMALEQASMQNIKAWAAANPDRYQEALNQNPSYVFFRELPAAGGPLGAMGVPLQAGFSIAVDPMYVPLGAPVYLATTYPLSPEPLERSVVAQDAGGAIRGAVRADFFWGTGPEAGVLAGRMRQPGRFWLLWPRGEPLPPRLGAASR
jgi:membrane-bound lytic murein transglycosylase A